MGETILRSEAWKLIDSGALFDLQVVSADLRRETGGRYFRLNGWKKRKGAPAEEAMPGEKRYKVEDGATGEKNHHKNKTCVIYNPNNREVNPMTIHWRLIQYLNGKRIING